MTKDRPIYSRNETVAALSSHYEFLCRIHPPSTVIKYPPPDGWPEITPEYLAFLNKTDTVVDLIRHLPLIQRDKRDDPYQIYEETAAVDCTGKLFHDSTTLRPPDPGICEPLPEISTVPSHVLTLATTRGGRDGHFVLVDTSRGTITICDFQVGGSATDLSLVIAVSFKKSN